MKSVTTTILKTRDFAASDLAEFIFQALPAYTPSIKHLIRARIRLWLDINSAEVKPKAKPKKPGKREQLKLKL